MRLIIANWKMNPQSRAEAKKLAVAVQAGLKPHPNPLLGKERGQAVEVVIAPPVQFFKVIRPILRKAKLGAQDLSKDALQAKITYAIIGHSDRRRVGETSVAVNKKIKLALRRKIHPIVCIGGEVKKNSTEAAAKRLIKNQLNRELRGIDTGKSKITIAFEPVWAISKGLGKAKQVKPQFAADMIRYIGKEVRNARVIYGGSITSNNANELAGYKVIEGGLVGGASLDAREFLKIVKAFTPTSSPPILETKQGEKERGL